MELHTTFESFCQTKINENNQDDVEKIPPGFRDDYPDEDNQKSSAQDCFQNNLLGR
jgi:hypothetical protein